MFIKHQQINDPVLLREENHIWQFQCTMAEDQKGELTKDEKLLLKAMSAQMQEKMKASLDKFRHELRQELQQATGQSFESRSSERRQRRGHEGRSNHKDKLADQKLKIPPFYGDADPAAYVEWEEKMELISNCQHYAERKKVQMATAEFYGYASSWWNQLVSSRRHYGKEPVTTLLKLRALMRHKYVPRQYNKEVLRKQSETKPCSANSVQKQQVSIRSIPASVIGLPSKTTSWFSEEDIKKLSQVVVDVEKQLKRTNTARPSIETQHQEPVTTVPELKNVELESAAPIQEVQTETSMEKENSETGQECSLFLPQSEFNFNNSFDELTCLEPVQPSSIVSVSQVAKEDSAEREPEQSTQGEKLEQPNSLQSNTTSESLSYDLQKHCKEFNMVTSVPEMFLMVSTHDVKRFGLDKVKDFCVSNSVYDSMLKTFKELEPDKLFDQKYFQYGNKNFSGHVLSFEQFMNHHEKIFEPVFKPTEFYFRKPFALFARTEENSFVVNFPRHELISDYFLAPTYVLKEPRKLHEPKLHHSDVRVEIVKSANISEFELDCLCAKNDSKCVGLFFEDILVYNTFFEKPVPQLKLEFTDSEYMNLILDDIWVCNIFFDMHNRWRNHTVLCFGDILVYNTFFDMITHLSCPKQAEKGTGKKKGYNDQRINDESLAKLEMQQSNLGNCPAASFDIGAVRGSYLSNQKELSNKLDFHGNLTHQGLTVNWNHVQSFSGERVMGSTSQVNLCLLCLNFSEFVTSQSYLWRPGEHAKVTNHVFKNSFIDYTDMMHLFLSKEPCADYEEALKHTRRKNKREEDKRFKPLYVNLERHQDITCFIIITEAPPDAAYNPKPSRNKFGIRLLLYDNFACANLFCFSVCESGLGNASGV
ncbi:uncharacterized protein LOC125581807 isoform X2 [Brassica napus]|uniref:uncharacterized protein LOC125581807 isoform X2 n=1 Tax=Brassica napus TaxID=3708 RepID=UPI002078657B|nr:uncharacterized protein LOC125581807 isoform X2 [Brassica napus]